MMGNIHSHSKPKLSELGMRMEDNENELTCSN